jgi:hypothetical protein
LKKHHKSEHSSDFFLWLIAYFKLWIKKRVALTHSLPPSIYLPVICNWAVYWIFLTSFTIFDWKKNIYKKYLCDQHLVEHISGWLKIKKENSFDLSIGLMPSFHFTCAIFFSSTFIFTIAAFYTHCTNREGNSFNYVTLRKFNFRELCKNYFPKYRKNSFYRKNVM